MESPESNEVLFTLNIDTKQLKESLKVYDHIKAHLKSGVIEFYVPEPHINIHASFASHAILCFQVADVISCSQTAPNLSKEVFSFKNTSYGGSFTHSRELFNPQINKAKFSFYKKAQIDSPQFVQSVFKYADGVSHTYHKGLMEDIFPIKGMFSSTKAPTNKIVFCLKTVTMLQKWIRELRKEDPSLTAIKLTINSTLAVVVITIGESSKTISYTPTEGDLSVSLQKGDKQRNWGQCTSDSELQVDITAFLQGLGVCRVPGLSLPALTVLNNYLSQIDSVFIKKGSDLSAQISVILLDVGSQPPPSQIIRKHFVGVEQLTCPTGHPADTPLSPSPDYTTETGDSEGHYSASLTQKRKKESKDYKIPSKKLKSGFQPVTDHGQ